MKLSELSPGDRFILNRNQQAYTLIGPFFWDGKPGKPTSRYEVKPDQPRFLDKYDEHTHSLSRQCQVTKIETQAPQASETTSATTAARTNNR